MKNFLVHPKIAEPQEKFPQIYKIVSNKNNHIKIGQN